MAQLFRYAVVGLLGTVCHYIVLVMLVELVLMGPLLASCWGFLAGALVNHELNRRFVFTASGRSYRDSSTRFLVVALLGFLLNLMVMAGLFHGMGLNYLLSQMLATGMVFLVSFTANKSWTFSAKRGKHGKVDDNCSRIQ